MDLYPINCIICNRYVLPVEGWTGDIPPYRIMVATWENPRRPIHGPLHFSCLRDWEHRHEFRDEFLAMLAGRHDTVELVINGETQQVRRNGLEFNDPVFEGDTCITLGSPSQEEWYVVENDGPWYHWDMRIFTTLGVGEEVATSSGNPVDVLLPPGDWSGIDKLSLEDLLIRLGVHDLYYYFLEDAEPRYEFLGYNKEKNILSYSLSTILPIPEEAADDVYYTYNDEE